ncbi:putative nibrin [Penaeus vannamei]|uniref:Putative nibrin n=1 Tax=Penaeus vannamei TaxID=6689 RepID=A0A3R7M7G4_PENVA|nr:putative nibrin [Penaeus vannamei]
MEARRSVLQGRTLLFSSAKQLSRMGPAVELAGGKAEALTAENCVHVTKDNYLVIQLPPDKNQLSQSNGHFTEAKKILEKKGLRVIPESDIGLAILYMNTEGHCNPAFFNNPAWFYITDDGATPNICHRDPELGDGILVVDWNPCHPRDRRVIEENPHIIYQGRRSCPSSFPELLSSPPLG